MSEDFIVQFKLAAESANEIQEYQKKTGAQSVCFFILEAIRFEIETQGKTDFQTSRCGGYDIGYHEHDDRQGNKAPCYSVLIKFQDELAKTISRWCGANDTFSGEKRLVDCSWLGKIIDTYKVFVDQKPKSESRLKMDSQPLPN